MNKEKMKFKMIKFRGNWKDELQYYQANFGRDYLTKTLKDLKDKNKWKKLNKHSLFHKNYNVNRNTRGFVDPKHMPTLEKVRGIVGLNDCQVVILKYDQGQTNLYHRDYIPRHEHVERPDIKLSVRKEVGLSNFERLLLMLEDRKPGQYMQIGDRMINKWQAGDCYIYNGKVDYHSAGNCGDHPRWVLRITGEPTEKFNKFLKKKEIKI